VKKRGVPVWNHDNEHADALLTSPQEFGATSIAAIYKNRWQVEPSFKVLKQNPALNGIAGNSENALLIQIRAALFSLLLLKVFSMRPVTGLSHWGQR
jgi:IS4 transposase